MTHRLSVALASLAVVAALPVAAIAQPAPPPGPQGMMMPNVDAPLLSFAITEEVKATPDRASIGAGVTTTAPTAVDAMRQNAAAMDRVIRALRAKRVPERDIQTSGISLQPQYDYSNRPEGQPPRFLGYQVSNSVRVTTANIAGLGDLLDTLVAAGGTNLEGPSFFLADSDASLEGAREIALSRAGERANRYARLAGYRSARLLALSEGQGGMPPPMPMARMQAMDVSAVATPVAPGQVSNSLTINVQYRLEK